MNKQIVSIYIKENFSDSLVGASKKIQKTQPRVYDAIYKYTDYLPKSASFSERCYNVENLITERPLCSCGNVLKFKSYKDGYAKKCSSDCKG